MKRIALFLFLLTLPVTAAFAQGQWSRVYHEDQHPSKQFDLMKVTHGAGRFVAVGYGNDRVEGGNPQVVIMTSSNGTDWSDVSPSLDVNASRLFDVIYVDGRFVAVGHFNTRATDYNEVALVLTSSDGLSWQWANQGAEALPLFWAYIAYGNGRYVLAADTALYYSGDLVHWTQASEPDGTAGFYWNDVAYGNGQFVTVGRYGGGYATYRLTSTDGASWSLQSDSQVAHQTVEYVNGGFLNMGAGSGMYRSNGASWEEVTPKLITATTVYSADYANGTYVIGGGAIGTGHNGGYVWVTSDFENWWEERLNGEREGGIRSLAHDDNGFVAISDDDAMIFHSPFSSASSAPQYTASRTIQAAVGEPLEYTVTASGLPAGSYYYHTYNLDPSVYSYELPDGLRFSYATGVGVLSGTPTAEGTTELRFSIKPSDTSSDGWRALEARVTLVVGASTTPACDGTLSVTDATGNTEVRGYPLNVGDTVQLSAGGIDCTGGAPEYRWSTTGFLGSASGPAGEVLTVTQDGLVTAVAEGYAFVRTEEVTTGQWVENTYLVSAAAAACDGDNLEGCVTVTACTGAGGYWNFDWCGAEPQSDPSHYPTYCEQGYTQYCEDTPDDLPGDDGSALISDWIPRTDASYQSVATLLQQADGYRLNGGAWSNGHANAAGEYDGNGIQSRTEYDFVGRTAYAAFMVHGGGSYAAWWVKPWYLPMHHMNSDHSWAGGLLIPDDTWIHATYTIGDDGQWSVVLASGDYEHLGGSVLHRESGTLSEEQRTQLSASPFLVTFGDNYAGTDAYMVIREAMVTDGAAAADGEAGCRASVSLQGELRIPCVEVGEAIYDASLILVDAPDIRFELTPGLGLSTVADAASDACLARYDGLHNRVHLPCVDVALAGGGTLAVWAELEPVGGPRFRVADFGAVQ